MDIGDLAAPHHQLVEKREGESIRPARRRDLLKMLEPIISAPQLEQIWDPMAHVAAALTESGELSWSIRISCRLRPRSAQPVVIPYRATVCRLALPLGEESIEIPLYLNTGEGQTPHRTTGLGEMTFAAPATVAVFALNHQTPLFGQPGILVCEVRTQALGAALPSIATENWIRQDPAPNQWWGYWRPPGPRSIYTM